MTGDKFAICDVYAYIVLSWLESLGFDIHKFPAAAAFYERVKALPNVQKAHARMAENPAKILG